LHSLVKKTQGILGVKVVSVKEYLGATSFEKKTEAYKK
jgi:hypothetical protein